MPLGFSPVPVHYGFNVTKEMTVEHSWGERIIPNFISTVAGQSLETQTQSKSARRKPISTSGPFYLHSHPSLCPRCCYHSSLCSALLQPCSPATVSPRSLGRTLYIESVTTYCPHMCSELAGQGQVRILATGTLILSTLAFLIHLLMCRMSMEAAS